MFHHGTCRSAARVVVREVCVTRMDKDSDSPAEFNRATTKMTFIRRCVLQVCCAGLMCRAFHHITDRAKVVDGSLIRGFYRQLEGYAHIDRRVPAPAAARVTFLCWDRRG